MFIHPGGVIIQVFQLKPPMHLRLFVLNWELCLKPTNIMKKSRIVCALFVMTKVPHIEYYHHVVFARRDCDIGVKMYKWRLLLKRKEFDLWN